MPENANDHTEVRRYRIGVASKLSGVATHTIRKWENRYGVVTPLRSDSGGRVYSEEQIRHLTRLKSLVDAGMAISKLAGLSDEQLSEAAATVLRAPGLPPTTDLQRVVMFVGEQLVGHAEAWSKQDSDLDVVAVPSVDEVRPDAARPDAVVCAFECLGDDALHGAHAIRSTIAPDDLIVLYKFAPRWVLNQLEAIGVTTIREPVSTAVLERLLIPSVFARHVAAPTITNAPFAQMSPPRFSESALIEVTDATVSMLCECPNHIAALLIDIGAFERYSEDCEIQQPEDAEEHRFLKATAAAARRLFEEALIRVAEKEGIALTAPTKAARGPGE
jgi:DNA-binding transcriptional MerR regulator